jgi:hypothetical protein
MPEVNDRNFSRVAHKDVFPTDVPMVNASAMNGF